MIRPVVRVIALRPIRSTNQLRRSGCDVAEINIALGLVAVIRQVACVGTKGNESPVGRDRRMRTPSEGLVAADTVVAARELRARGRELADVDVVVA